MPRSATEGIAISQVIVLMALGGMLLLGSAGHQLYSGAELTAWPFVLTCVALGSVVLTALGIARVCLREEPEE